MILKQNYTAEPNHNNSLHAGSDKISPAEFRMGTSSSFSGSVLGLDKTSLLLNGKRWLPVMGEFHFSRYDPVHWRTELLKVKMGGIDIISTYVFWIHHEEIEGQWNWLERRDLRQFITLCRELNLYAVVRCGPWCHGECRYGGLPDWLLRKPCEPRSNDAMYLKYCKILYSHIEYQLHGLLWKDNGPVIGIQCENEYSGPAEHLIALKQIAIEVGLDVPLYTRTGWPELSTPMSHGEFAPLYGGYPDGFWDRSLAQMPPGYADNFLFRSTRNDASVATDQLGSRDPIAELENELNPYFACEIGGGMMPSYHRRIRIAPQDIEALALAKLGSGNNLQGYYMFHGGTNPEGKLNTLQESQDTGYWNDLPITNYDFQAPLGEFGQVRPHYHSLRKMHLFLRDWGEELAAMKPAFPECSPINSQDLDTLRWAIRTDGTMGFLFVNNYQRLVWMDEKKEVQFQLKSKSGLLTIPERGMKVPANTCFILPFNINFNGAKLIYATAQLICKITIENTTTVIFGEIEGISAEFLFKHSSECQYVTKARQSSKENTILFSELKPGTHCAIEIESSRGHTIQIVLLSAKESLNCWKGILNSAERIFITSSTLILDNEKLMLQSHNLADLGVSVFPPDVHLTQDDAQVPKNEDGIFLSFKPEIRSSVTPTVDYEQIKEAGEARAIRLGCQGVAEAPTDDEFKAAAVWRILFPKCLTLEHRQILTIKYLGDVARIYLKGKMLLDDFYNGNAFELEINSFIPEIFTGELTLHILPLSKSAPIYIQEDAVPDFQSGQSVCLLQSVEIIPVYEVVLVS